MRVESRQEAVPVSWVYHWSNISSSQADEPKHLVLVWCYPSPRRALSTMRHPHIATTETMPCDNNNRNHVMWQQQQKQCHVTTTTETMSCDYNNNGNVVMGLHQQWKCCHVTTTTETMSCDYNNNRNVVMWLQQWKCCHVTTTTKLCSYNDDDDNSFIWLHVNKNNDNIAAKWSYADWLHLMNCVISSLLI